MDSSIQKILLTVCQADEEDVYRDVIRIPKEYRKNIKGVEIPSGTICKVVVGNVPAYAIVRGKSQATDANIYIDAFLRKKLSVSLKEKINVSLSEANLIGKGWWALNTTDPGYRISAWIAVFSFFIPLLISLISWICNNFFGKV